MISRTSISSLKLNIWGWLGLFVLLGFMLFKWLPDLLWRAEAPEIRINNYIFEVGPVWSIDGLVVKSTSLPKVYIRVYGKNAIDQRAGLTVTVDGTQVDDNCSGSSEQYFCYQIEKPENGRAYEIIARNSAGEVSTKLKVLVEPKNNSSTPPSSTSSHSNSQAPSSSGATNSLSAPSPNSSVSPTNDSSGSSGGSACLHYEAGRCWDDIELDAYAKGLYDQQFGDYGASQYYDDTCDRICQDIIDEAYDEGWYDRY